MAYINMNRSPNLFEVPVEKAINELEAPVAHAADFIVRRTTEDVSPDAPVLTIQVPEQPIKAESN